MHRLILLAALSLAPLASLPAHAQEVSDAVETAKTKAKLQKAYIKQLEGMGYEPRLDDDGDVLFTKTFFDRELTLFVHIDGEDPSFYRLVLANIWPIESKEEAIRAVAASATVGGKVKTGKVVLVDNNVWVTSESFVSKPSKSGPTIERSLTVVEDSLALFVKAMTDEG